MTSRRADLDQVDRKILNILQNNCKITNVELAEMAATSAPSCLRRVKRLRDEGYIEREVALVNPEKVGASLVAISEVRLTGHNLQAREKAIQTIRNIPEVTQCYNVTGDKDLLFIAILTDMADFEETITEPLAAIPEIRSINSYFAIKRVKFAPMIHFDEER
ncbi:Lrp/AsnC family transcriptional regulator [Kiloniella antarctica]|uniref:Lrp/AsnC family transcriptional regulator n=1 Tax=Kiloniella antarctica TaxID=1550907 RepID=A0ABW5BRK1_9PROT